MRAASSIPAEGRLESPAGRRPAALVFGPAARPLFGWHHSPAEGPTRRLGVVLCNPFGYEAMCTHRAYRHLAAELVAAGFHVLRFDYDGAGDSFGLDADPGRVAAWLASVDEATAALRHRTGVSGVCLFGLRLGALLALSAAARRDDVRALLLWAMPASGRAYVREARAFGLLQQKEGSTTREPAPGQELAGYHLTPETLADLGKLQLPDAAPGRVSHALVLSRDDVEDKDAEPARRLASLGVQVEAPAVPGYADLLRDPEFSRIPDQAIAAMREWLVRVDAAQPVPAGAWVAPTAAPELPAFPIADAAGHPARERLVRFGSSGSLVGLLAEPPAGAPVKTTAVLFLSVGANHHVGSSRLYVTLSRELAGKGYRALRLDVGGVGDSPPTPGHGENELYSKRSVTDVQAAMDFLGATTGATRFVVAGICSGAFLSFHTCAADERVVGQILINPQTFVWRDGDSLEIKKGFKSSAFYKRAALRRETWQRLLQGRINARSILREMLARFGKRLEVLPFALPFEDAQRREHRAVRRAFLDTTDRGVESLLVYGADDAGLDTIERYLGREARALSGRPNVSMVVLDDVDHTFTPQWSQAWLAERILDHVTRRFD